MKKIARKNITEDVILEDIVSLVREAFLSCYGVCGFANLSKKEGKVEEGLSVRLGVHKRIFVEAYLVVSKDVKITETIRSCQDTVIYRLKRIFPKHVASVEVYAEEIASRM